MVMVASLQFGGSEAGEKRYLVLSSVIHCLWGAEFLTAHQKLMLSSFLLKEKQQ